MKEQRTFKFALKLLGVKVSAQEKGDTVERIVPNISSPSSEGVPKISTTQRNMRRSHFSGA